MNKRALLSNGRMHVTHMESVADTLRRLLDPEIVDIAEEKDATCDMKWYKLNKAVDFTCSHRKKQIKSKIVVVNISKRELVSNGAYGELLALQNTAEKSSEPFRKTTVPSGPDKYIFRPASTSKSGAMKCQCYSKGQCSCGNTAVKSSEPFRKTTAPGGPDKYIFRPASNKYIFRPASKSGAMKCAACQCYSKGLTETGRCSCGNAAVKNSEPFRKTTAPGGPDKHIFRPASKSGAMKCAACQCYSKGLNETGRCSCGK
jgi:hypothetical protein